MRHEYWYRVTLIGLRKKPFTTELWANSPQDAEARVRATWHVKEIKKIELIPSQEPALAEAVEAFLSNPKKPGALARLTRAFRGRA